MEELEYLQVKIKRLEFILNHPKGRGKAVNAIQWARIVLKETQGEYEAMASYARGMGEIPPTQEEE